MNWKTCWKWYLNATGILRRCSVPRKAVGKILRKLYQIGVTEIGCLIDFGIENDKVMAGLILLDELKKEFKGEGVDQDQHITSMQITLLTWAL